MNCHAQAILSNYFLKGLTARPARSALVSVGTNAAEPQNPRYKFALYGATKSYGHILSSGIEECYGDQGGAQFNRKNVNLSYSLKMA